MGALAGLQVKGCKVQQNDRNKPRVKMDWKILEIVCNACLPNPTTRLPSAVPAREALDEREAPYDVTSISHIPRAMRC